MLTQSADRFAATGLPEQDRILGGSRTRGKVAWRVGPGMRAEPRRRDAR